MRERVIRPEIWQSEKLSRLPVRHRLLFIGLWSYVDDDGVGRDKLSRITADLFADDLERDPAGTYQMVKDGLEALAEAGLIVRGVGEGGQDQLGILDWYELQKSEEN